MITFPQFDLQDPQEDKLLADFEGVLDSLEGEASSAVRLDKLEAWERARRSFQDWRALVGVRFHQDTQDEARRKRRERSDELDARITTLDAKIKRAFIAALPDEAVEARVGDTALARWAADVKSGDPALEEDLIAESKLGAAYTALRGGAKVEFEGQTYPIPAMGKFAVDSDRERRLAAHEALWSWWASNGGDVDRIYDELVTLRHGMAQRLGLSSFVELGYLRMHRVDYTREDVGHFRTAVQEHVVSLAGRLFADQAKRLGVDPLRHADEGVHHPEGNPEPVAGLSGAVSSARLSGATRRLRLRIRPGAPRPLPRDQPRAAKTRVSSGPRRSRVAAGMLPGWVRRAVSRAVFSASGPSGTRGMAP